MLFETPTQFAVLALALIAGWFFGLASHPGGKKWKRRYHDEKAAHDAVMKEREGTLGERDARIKELEAENVRLTRELERRGGHGTVTTAAAAGAAGVATGAAATHHHEHKGSGWRGWFGWDRDNLSRIKGIDEPTEKALIADGVKTFEQIANLTDAEAHALEDKLGFGRGRIDQQQWREQARMLIDDHGRDHGIARA